MERKEVERCLEKIESALAGKVCDEREVCMILRTIHLYIIRLEKENNRLIETLATHVMKVESVGISEKLEREWKQENGM